MGEFLLMCRSIHAIVQELKHSCHVWITLWKHEWEFREIRNDTGNLSPKWEFFQSSTSVSVTRENIFCIFCEITSPRRVQR